MRYVHAPQIEVYEQTLLPSDFQKAYFPQGEVTLHESVTLQANDVQYLNVENIPLAVQPATASWSFLSSREAQLLHAMDAPRTLSWLQQQWPAGNFFKADDFAAALFRRGLLRINGEANTDSSIFADSANVKEGHLVEMLLSEKCNLACTYCLAGAGTDLPHMDASIAKRSVDLAFAMRQAESITFEFSGGEPMLRFELMRELVDYIQNHPAREGRKVYFCIQTNGTLFTQDRVAWLKEHNVQVGLSLDGDPISHNRSRPQVNGKESFSRVLQGLDLLQRAEVPFGVLVVLNRSNAHSAQALIDFLVDNGITGVKLNPVAYLGDARATWNDVGLAQEEIIDYFAQFTQLLVSQNHPIVEANIRDMMWHLVSKQRPSRCLRGHCGAGESFQAIAANGDIYPCGRSTQSPEWKLGEVTAPLASLAAPAATNANIQTIKNRRPVTLEGCAQCAYQEMCQAGCPAQAFERYRSARHRTPECAFNKTMYPYLMHALSFDDALLHFADRYGYFGEEQGHIQRVQRPYLPD